MPHRATCTLIVSCLALLGVILSFKSMTPILAAASLNETLHQQTPIVNPEKNSHNVPTTSTVSITYDEAIDSRTVSSRTFVVNAMQTGLLTQTYTVTNGEISLIPSTPFKAGEIVHSTATTRTLTLAAQGPVTPTVWIFRVNVSAGLGIFVNSGQTLSTGRANDVSLGDLDNDGDLDAFVTNDFIDSDIFFNDGKGTFRKSGNSPGAPDSSGVLLGDLDGDGDLDAFITRRNNRPDKILLNDGLGNFGENTQGLGNFDSWGAALGDLDGDGDLDAFVANGFDNEANRVWFNNGIGVFSEGQSLGDDHSSSVALGDLDNDGDLDAFVANSERQADRVYLNDGSGNFQETFQGLGESSGSDVALGDWDNDGDLDALVVNFDGINQVWLNSGTGIFGQGQSWGTGGSNSYYGLDVGDVDHDGDLDAFIADYAPNPGQLSPNEIWLNDGSGNFTKSNQNLSSSYSLRSFAVALGDLDNDGDLDAFIANDLTIFGPDGETFAEVWVNTNDQSFLPVISR